MKVKRKRALIRELISEARMPSAQYRGGFGSRIRRQQALMQRAADELARWGANTDRRQLNMLDAGDAT